MKELVWIRQLLSDLDYPHEEPVPLHIDSQSAIRLIKNPEFHRRTKHVDIRFHYIRDKFNDNTLIPEYVKSDEQCADFLTKPLAKNKFHNLIKLIGMVKYDKALK